MISLEKLVHELGYAPSHRNWVQADSCAPHVLRRAAEAGVAVDATVAGAYVFHTSQDDSNSPSLPPQVAVLVAQADDDDRAHRLRKSLWNLGCAPFVIIVLPNEVRVYKGFSFDQEQENSDIIQRVPATTESIKDALSDFYAEEIDSGRIWEKQAHNLSLDTRVDRRLLRNLNDLGNELVHRRGLPTDVAHALIGKYIYINYLRQRGILSDEWLASRGLDLNDILGQSATLDGLLGLVEALDHRFNGEVFPLPLTDKLDDDVVAYVASVFHGDEAYSRQLAFDFQAYDFSYIPIETLSLIYEQFLHREVEDREEGKGKLAGAYYTPAPLAEYLVCELNYELPLSADLKVLDPCCGSGVFLVMAYRRLIDLELARRADRKLSPDELSLILQRNIFGVECNLDACYVTEFSLILTLLSYVEPPDLLHNEAFKFPVLHNNNIFKCDFFDDKSLFWRKKLRFDWIIGNPPWILLKDSEERPDDRLALQWIARARTEGRIVDLDRLQDAFCWRSVEVMAKGGHAGLVMHAKSLTNERCSGFRSSFFKSVETKRITNFSNLAYRLFAPRAEAPAATIVFALPDEKREKPDIIHYGPFAANQVPTRWTRRKKDGAWSITICQSEISTVSPEDAESGDAQTWKLALWGSYRDKRAIERLHRLFPTTLGALCEERRGWHLEKGLQLREEFVPQDDSSKDQRRTVPVSDELKNVLLLNAETMGTSGFHFVVPPWVLEPLSEEKLHVRERSGKAGLRIVHAPHMFITSNFAAYSDQDFVLPHAKIGISVPALDADCLRALSVLLNSSAVRYLLFFRSAAWGVDRSVIEKNEVSDTPIPVLVQEQVSELALLHRRLSATESSCRSNSLFGDAIETRIGLDQQTSLQEECDEAVERIVGISGDLGTVVRDFWRVRYELIKGKTGGTPARMPTHSDLSGYAECLRQQLDQFATAHHRISIRKSADYIVCTVQITCCHDPIPPEVVESSSPLCQAESELWRLLRRQQSQWAYVQRGLRVFEGAEVHIYKSPRLLEWTKTQALLDADDIVNEVLAHRRPGP